MLPGSHTYYNLGSLCEDYEMTLAMRTLGYKMISPGAVPPADPRDADGG